MTHESHPQGNQIDIQTRDMVWVPGGCFTMGSAIGVGDGYEWPAHPVTLTGFWMDRYPVTAAQYLAFCADTGWEPPSFPKGYSWAGKTGWNDPALQQHPIVNVSWHDAKAYADWAGLNLPTEAQWEYAARGPQGRNYPWGGRASAADTCNGWDQTKCAHYANSFMQNISTWPVGSFTAGASWCGVCDLAGTVWEWCADWYGPYAYGPVANPVGPADGSCRVLRGGSWDNSELACRGAFRDFNKPDYRGCSIGFRCVSNRPGP